MKPIFAPVFPLVFAVALSGCAAVSVPQTALPGSVAGSAAGDRTRPQARPAALTPPAPRPPANARTQEQFDTTTKAERAAAAAKPEPAAEVALGSVVVSLGDVTLPGFWLETALVKAPGTGRVVFPDTGQSAQVALRPSDGGSRLSLAAMRLIGAPLTALPTVQVFQLP